MDDARNAAAKAEAEAAGLRAAVDAARTRHFEQLTKYAAMLIMSLSSRHPSSVPHAAPPVFLLKVTTCMGLRDLLCMRFAPTHLQQVLLAPTMKLLD